MDIEKSKWSTEILPLLEVAINEYISNWTKQNSIDEYVTSEKEYNNSKIGYKKNHNKFLYFFLIFIMPFAFLLFVYPGVLVFKKFKDLKKNKNILLDIIEEKTNSKLATHNSIILTIDQYDIYKQIEKIFKYKHMGPITSTLIDEMQALSLFDLSSNDNRNSYNSSWGILDGNKIIINFSTQTHKTFIKTYTGSKNCNYYDGDKWVTKVVTATYDHPAKEINASKLSYVFMESCSNLEFNYEGLKGFTDKFKNKEQSQMENPIFEKKFLWKRNDETQFRMIFTPLAQEEFLIETSDKNNNVPKPQDEYNKKSSFLGNKYFYNNKFNYFTNLKSILNEFSKSADISINNFKNNIIASLKDISYDKFNALKFMWTLPILQSEDSSLVLKSIVNKNNFNKYNDSVPHYLLNEIFDKKIIYGDIDTFNLIKSKNKINIGSHSFHCVHMDGISYNTIKKTATIPVSGELIPVDYIDYIPINGQISFVYSFIKTDKYYFNNSTNIINIDIIESIKNIESNNVQISIINNLIILKSTNENEIDTDLISGYINLIINKINN